MASEPATICERCLNPFDLVAGGVAIDVPYRLTVPDKHGREQLVWQVGKCYICGECLRKSDGKVLP